MKKNALKFIIVIITTTRFKTFIKHKTNMSVSETVLKVYSAYRKGNLNEDQITIEIDNAIKNKHVDDLYQLSRMIYSRGKEINKIEVSKKLLLHGYKDIIPIDYLKKLKTVL